MKFDFCIGNPPYQETTESESTRMPPIYDKFMDESHKIASAVELITPARFLFDAGFTSHAWNMQMLEDVHFKVQKYEPDCTKVFPNTDIKGGVAISYWDEKKEYTPILIFTKYPELNAIIEKIQKASTTFVDSIVFPALNYKVSDIFLEEHPNTIGRLRTNAFTSLAPFFFEKNPDDAYVSMLGILDNKRTIKYIKRKYLKDTNDLLDSYNLIMAVVNGNGIFGEVLSQSYIAKPGCAYTQSFVGIGCYRNSIEVEHLDLYIKTKFCRTMLGVMKITPQCAAGVWKYVPLQDFTDKSDIDWSQSIADIDKQLYKKYGLSEDEINFIETHVKEMV